MRFSSCFSILGAVVVTTNTVLAQDSCMTIADIACTTDGFETLCNLVASAGLDDVLSDESTDLTVFAPQDAAFEALGSEVIDALINSEDDLLDVLLYHVVDESLNSTDLNCEPGENLVEMLNGKNSRTICDGDAIYQKGDGNLREDMPQIIAADIEACNGVVHVVDKVLIPPNFLGGSTPSEAPVTEAPATASPGTEAPATASPGTEAPVTASPGTEAPDPPTAECQSIAEQACGSESLSFLCNLITEFGLVDVLNDDTWTVFAPLNEAFEEISEVLGTLDNSTVLDVLLFHAIAGEAVFSTDLPCEAGNNLLEMYNGKDSRTLCVDDVPTYQKGADNSDDNLPAFTTVDVTACNGVIHIIDGVLLPPNTLP